MPRRPKPSGVELLLWACVLGVFFSCSPIDRFSEYRGVNLLEGISFGEWTPDYNEASAPEPANTDGGVYMLYEPAGATAGYNGSEAYRLRTKNLFPNGDFEDPLSGWTVQGTGSSYSLTNAAGEAIQGNSLKYTILNSSHYIYFPLSSLSDGFILSSSTTTAQYTFRFDLNYPGAPSLSFDLNTDPSSDSTHYFELPKPAESLSYYRYPTDFPASPLINTVFRSDNTPYFFFLNTDIPNKGDAQTGILDSIRFLRNDLEYKVRLVLERNDPERLPLPSGSYRFSFYVKQDPQAGSGNVFPASRLSFGIGSASNAVDAPSVNSDWTLVEGTFNNLQIDPGSTMELWISATDSSNSFYQDCGSILLSSPSLEFLPE